MKYCLSEHDAELGKELVDDDDIKVDSRDSESTAWSIDKILSSLRKLREATLPQTPDDFSKRVFMFSTKVSILAKSYHSYHPALSHLLGPYYHLLSDKEHAELAAFQVLHLSHFNFGLNEAYNYHFSEISHNRHIEQIVNCLGSDDKFAWIKLYQSEKSPYNKALMSFAYDRIMRGLISNIGKAYMMISKPALESMVGVPLETLKENYSCGWLLEDDKVIIRKRKAAAVPAKS